MYILTKTARTLSHKESRCRSAAMLNAAEWGTSSIILAVIVMRQKYSMERAVHRGCLDDEKYFETGSIQRFLFLLFA